MDVGAITIYQEICCSAEEKERLILVVMLVIRKNEILMRRRSGLIESGKELFLINFRVERNRVMSTLFDV